MQNRALSVLFSLVVFAATSPVAAQQVFPQYPSSDTPSSSAWFVDRFAPAVFSNAGTLNGRDNVLDAGVAAADGLQARPFPFNGPFYNTQGRKIQVGSTPPVSWIGSLYIPSAWGTPNPTNGSGSRRTDLWAGIGPASDTGCTTCDFSIIGFSNATDADNAPGTTPRYRVFDPNVGFVDLNTPVTFDAWTDFCATWNGTDIEFRIGNQLVYTVAGTPASTVLEQVIVNTYNFGYTYDSNWSNLATGSGSCQQLQALFRAPAPASVRPAPTLDRAAQLLLGLALCLIAIAWRRRAFS